MSALASMAFIVVSTFLASPAGFTRNARPGEGQPSTATPLEGTAWQLVEFKGGDGTTLTPDDRAKYTVEFGADGQLSARIDCNRGRGTWKSSGSNQIQFGPLALTRAQCPPGSLHDRIVKQWGYVRSYLVRDGHLFLALMADGGIYEFGPLKKPKAPGRGPGQRSMTACTHVSSRPA